MSDATKITEEMKKSDVPNRMPPKEAIDRLKSGNERYKNDEITRRSLHEGREARKVAQYPFAAILSCADSRIAPELAFDQGLGDLFVVRLAGNFVNEDGLASLEYAVEFLNVGLIVVLGHTNCGAVDAALKVIKEKVELPGALPNLIDSIKPVVRETVARHFEGDLLNAAIRDNVRMNVKRLLDAEPLIAERVKCGEIDVVGAVYDLSSGHIRFLDEDNKPPL